MGTTKASSIVLGTSILERFVVKARNEGDRLSYYTNLELGCCVHDLTPFLSAIGSSSLSKMVSRLLEDENPVPNISSDFGQCTVLMSGLFPWELFFRE